MRCRKSRWGGDRFAFKPVKRGGGGGCGFGGEGGAEFLKIGGHFAKLCPLRVFSKKVVAWINAKGCPVADRLL